VRPKRAPKPMTPPDEPGDDTTLNPPPAMTPVDRGDQARVIRNFTAAGRLFEEGDIVDLSSPLVQAIAAEYPATVVARYLKPV
jgi:hypothetical protein